MIGLTADEAARNATLRRAHASNARARAFLRFAGLTIRRKSGRLPRNEARAFARIVAESELEPRELIDLLLGAVLDVNPGATVAEIASWLVPRQVAHYRPAGALTGRFDSDAAAIIKGEQEGPDATPIARGPARNEGGSQQ